MLCSADFTVRFQKGNGRDTLGIPRDAKKGTVGTLGIPGEAEKRTVGTLQGSLRIPNREQGLCFGALPHHLRILASVS